MKTEEQTDDKAVEQTTPASSTAVHSHRRVEYIAEGFRNKTKGEFIFNNIVYTGISYFGVMAVSIFSSWLLRDNKMVAPQYKKLVNLAQEKWPSKGKTGKELQDLHNAIDSNMTIGAFFLGGTIATVLPVKWFEDKKATIVRSLDNWLYGRERAETDPQIVSAHILLDEAPKQTWLSVALSRVLAFGMTFGTSALMGPQESPIGRMTGHSIDKDSARFGRWADKAFHKKNPEIVAQIERAAAASPNVVNREGPHADRVFSRIGSYIGLDAFYTAITTATLFCFTRILAPLISKENLPAEAPQIARPPVAPVLLTQPSQEREETTEKPKTLVAHTALHDRVAQQISPELSA